MFADLAACAAAVDALCARPRADTGAEAAAPRVTARPDDTCAPPASGLAPARRKRKRKPPPAPPTAWGGGGARCEQRLIGLTN